MTVDYGIDRANGGVEFGGTAAYAQLRPLPWLACALRVEVLFDPQGFTTGTPQNVIEGTANVDVSGSWDQLNLTGRLEYRHDSSTALVFQNGPKPASRDWQDTLTLALVLTFDFVPKKPKEGKN